MAEAKTSTIDPTDLDAHPALQAWRELRTEHRVPQRIEVLKGKGPGQTSRLDRIVCRIVGVGPAGSAVIAKRCKRASGLIENTIYEQVLPDLPISRAHYFGMLEEANGQYCWLFLEDAGTVEYSKHNEGHRRLLASWLGQMHTSASQLAPPASLPDKGPGPYLERLQFVRASLLEHLARLAQQAISLPQVETTLGQLDIMESHWEQVQDLCEGSPHTLVHGDLAAKNIRLRNGRDGMTVLPFDWGDGGWGTPALDIMQVDAAGYGSMVRHQWPWLDVEAVRRLELAGKFFRCLDAIYWELPSFDFDEWLEYTMRSMRIYSLWLDDAMRAAGWQD